MNQKSKKNPRRKTMNKDQLQQELLAKIKLGTKPSDLKKSTKKLSQTSQTPPPIDIKDEGYESDKSGKSIPTASLLPNQQDWSTQINSLQKQLQLYKDFRESDLKIKEK